MFSLFIFSPSLSGSENRLEFNFSLGGKMLPIEINVANRIAKKIKAVINRRAKKCVVILR